MSATTSVGPALLLLLLPVGSILVLTGSAHAITPDDRQYLCKERSCYPATGNLLVGREKRLYASSTCGLEGPQRYCIISHLQDEKKCSVCDSRQPWGSQMRSHRIENVVSTFSTDRLRKWWQAENGLERAYIQLDLGAEFHFTHLVISFKTFRPKSMLIERSYDFGSTWHVYRYFAHSCRRSFPRVPMGPVRNLADVICEERYSDVVPATEGEVIFKVLPPNIEIDNPYEQKVQDLIKLTNLRINFTELHTLGDDLLDKVNRNSHKEKYYYAIYDMVVRGSCSCYGHASRCIPADDEVADFNPDMVYGKCECTHNTRGLNCEQCQEFYNDLPWKPARGSQTNTCKRCECHGHATRCHFDPAIFEATNRTSGGVCDDCAHNTMGRNCQECQHFFYQDRTRDLSDPLICKPCDCDPNGSQNKGECDSHDDPEGGLVAGRCTCKSKVSGIRCDTCLDGFWNLQPENPNGCQACACNTQGTFESRGCDKLTGTCTCKRHVTGENCDQCADEFWGLSNEDDGCRPCNCDRGGSFNNSCDSTTGQCICRPNIIGRRCDQPRPGYFIADLTYLAYEAEYALGVGKSQVVVREPVPGYTITWTGPGFMRTFEGDRLVFTIDSIPKSMNYHIVIRYESQLPRTWTDVRVTIIRPSETDPDGPCGNQLPVDDNTQAYLPPDSLYHIVSPTICFETGKVYQIQIDLPDYKYPGSGGREKPSVLIDSILLVPVALDVIGTILLPGITSSDLQYCIQYELDPASSKVLPEQCKAPALIISSIVQNKAIDCDCEPTGSLSTICDGYGGQCKCKPNVIGRRCDQCVPGAYGFGPTGCLACNCHGQGARDNFCDVLTGQCLCINNIVSGRMCDTCRPGYFGFPACQRCQCNGHTQECDEQGRCLACSSPTTGDYCERCLPGYYGDPRVGSQYPCRPCSCPGGVGSGAQHADRCSLDSVTRDMLCECPEGYSGSRCELCADNYHGNPVVPGGSCSPCLCNGNIDRSVPGGCNQTTGACTKCLFNTAGDQCEVCADGYYGDAALQTCQKCACNMLGSNREAAATCDHVTGQCPCLPNVAGRLCDRCEADHWKLASGLGCEACDCDLAGSSSTQCNEFDGQCACIPGRGGRQCNQCEDFQWGDPEKGSCQPCSCNADGSLSLQCDSATGECPCLPGVAGMHCDRCDRGTSGALPNCVPCGECFESWDAIVKDIRVRAIDLIQLANVTRSTGVLDAYEDEFKEIRNGLSEVAGIIDAHNISTTGSDGILTFLDAVKGNLTHVLAHLRQLENNVTTRSADLTKLSGSLLALESMMVGMINRTEEMRELADKAIQGDINGAFNNIVEKAKTSNETAARVAATKSVVAESARTRAATDDYLMTQAAVYKREAAEVDMLVEQLDSDIINVTNYIRKDLNKQVCDRSSLELDRDCDAVCGGGGCSSCGAGPSCSNGAKGRAAAAQELVQKTTDVLSEKMSRISDANDDLQSALEYATTARHLTAEAHTAAADVNSRSKKLRSHFEFAQEMINNFLNQTKASPDDVRQYAEDALSKAIPLSSDEISELAHKINETVRSLTDIDAVLNDTADDLAKTTILRDRADNASKQAAFVLRLVEVIHQQLSAANEAQNRSREAIDRAVVDVTEAEQDLLVIENLMNGTVSAARQVDTLAKSLAERVQAILKKTLPNKDNLEKAEKVAKEANESSAELTRKTNELREKYGPVAAASEARHNASQNAKARVERLTSTSARLAAYILMQRNQLVKMQTEFVTKEQQLEALSKQINDLLNRMQNYSSTLGERERFHRSCLTASLTVRRI